MFNHIFFTYLPGEKGYPATGIPAQKEGDGETDPRHSYQELTSHKQRTH